jgi:hypothetical protein
VLAAYVGSLLFGGVLIVASLLGVGHGSDVHVDLHVGDTGHGAADGHDQSQASSLLSLFGLRFWSFGTAFFGLTGVILHLVGGPVLAAFAPFIASGCGRARSSGARDACCCRSRAGSAARCASSSPAAATSI